MLLLALAAFLIRKTRHAVYPNGFDTSGVLQIAWLLGNEPRLAEVKQPDLDTLRVAGMYEIDHEALRFRRVNASSSSAMGKEENDDMDQYLYLAQSQHPSSFTA